MVSPMNGFATLIKGFGGLEQFRPKRRRRKPSKSDDPSQKSDVSEKSDDTRVSDESNKSTQWNHSWLVNNSQSQGSTDRQIRGPTGPNRSEIFKNLLVLVRSGLKFFWVLVRAGPGPTGFRPWIPGQSLLEDQVSNLSLSVSLTQSSEETDLQEKQVNNENVDGENPDGENVDDENVDDENDDNENVAEKADLSGEENLDEALMSILENFSDDDQGSL